MFKGFSVMRYFTLLAYEDIILYLLPALIFLIVFGVGLGFMHFRGKDLGAEKRDVQDYFPDGIQDRKSPFPLVMTLIIIGTILWMLGYILITGLLGVRI